MRRGVGGLEVEVIRVELDFGLGEIRETGEFQTEQRRYLQRIHCDWGGISWTVPRVDDVGRSRYGYPSIASCRLSELTRQFAILNPEWSFSHSLPYKVRDTCPSSPPPIPIPHVHPQQKIVTTLPLRMFHATQLVPLKQFQCSRQQVCKQNSRK